MYEDIETTTYVMLVKKENILKVYVDGLMFNIPIQNKAYNQQSFLEAVSKTEDLNLDNNSLEDLEDMLMFYEKEEDFEKCSKIKIAIANKSNKYSE